MIELGIMEEEGVRNRACSAAMKSFRRMRKETRGTRVVPEKKGLCAVFQIEDLVSRVWNIVTCPSSASFERYLGISAGLLIRLQAEYDLSKAVADKGPQIERGILPATKLAMA